MSAAPPPTEPSQLDELSPAAAEDVVQEAFLRLMAGAEKIEGRSRLSTWLYRGHAAESPSLDAGRRQALLRRLEKACRRDDDPV